MDVGRQNAWRIGQDNISTDFAVGRLGVKHHAFFHQVSAVTQPSYFVIEAFIGKAGFHKLNLFFGSSTTSADMTAV